ncbi:hypothetical protein FRC12_018198 [Ceratobasidium sp. 428]|nr:hypothetical protein FRC12_018198 [Ceratobasidium sp. 428]
MIWSASLLPVLALAASAAPNPAPAQPVTVPLTRRQLSKREHDLAWAKSQGKWLNDKWSENSRKRASGINDLVNRGTDSSYYGSIAVGTPPVAFNVILDTGERLHFSPSLR